MSLSTPATTHSATLPARGSASYLGAICLAASLGGLLFGFDTAVISGTVASVSKQYALDEIQKGWFLSSALLGCIAGAAVAGVLSDRFGRRPALMMSGLFFLLSAVVAAGAPSYAWLVSGRVMAGLGVGVASVVAPMYICEFAPPRFRGRLVAFYQLSIVLGILAAYLSNWLLACFAERNSAAAMEFSWLQSAMVDEVWRAMFAAGALPAVFFLAMLAAVPESPRWLAKAGRREAALWSLARVEGAEIARREIATIERADAEEPGSIAELLRPGLRRALLVGLGLSVFGQLSGVNIVVYYGPDILRSAGFPSADALRWQVVIGIINLIFTVIALWKVDGWGRRPLLIGGMAVVALSMAATAGLYRFGAPSIWIVFTLCVYMACEALSICAVIWILTAEIFPNRVRGRAVSIATFANWSVNWFSAFLFPWYVKTFGLAAGFMTFAAICFAATVFFWWLVPETKGKSLEEIALHWQAAIRSPNPRL